LIYGGSDLQLDGHIDSNFLSDIDDRKPTSGHVFICNGGAVSWKSSKQSTTTDSTIEAEYIVASDAAKKAIWIYGTSVSPDIQTHRKALSHY